MVITPEQHAILSIFLDHDIQEGEYLSVQTLDRERLALPKPVQEKWTDLLRGLVSAGIVSYDPLGYGLTEKGRSQVYSSLE